MNFPVERWYESIFSRRSRRRYDEHGLEPDMVSHLRDFTSDLNNFTGGARAVLVTESPEKVFKGIIGSYGRIKGAPAYAAFIGDVHNPYVHETVGYMGECFILEATSLGLGTCWVGGFFDSEVVKSQVHIEENEKVFAVTPVGFAVKEHDTEEKMMSGFVSSHKRKDLRSLCRGVPRDQWPDWVKTALEAARLAPSAINRQPWRFLAEKDAITISVDSAFLQLGVSKRLDCGIAMLHLELGARTNGVKGEWESLNSPDVARFVVKAG